MKYVDNINGDVFIINCTLLCVILSIVFYIATLNKWVLIITALHAGIFTWAKFVALPKDLKELSFLPSHG